MPGQVRISHEVTTSEAAALVGVKDSTIWKWVSRGYLAPIRLGEKPLRFQSAEVITCHAARMPKAWRARVADAAARWANE